MGSATNRLDHVFFLEEKDKEGISLVFCNSTLDKDIVKNKVIEVLKREEFGTFSLDYLGRLDYQDMEERIHQYLTYFEKFDDVWILKLDIN